MAGIFGAIPAPARRPAAALYACRPDRGANLGPLFHAVHARRNEDVVRKLPAADRHLVLIANSGAAGAWIADSRHRSAPSSLDGGSGSRSALGAVGGFRLDA